MELEVLLSCMHQQDTKLVHASRLTGNVLVINQCDREDTLEEAGPTGRVRMLSTTERGLTRSRNMAIRQSQADVCLLCDDDEIFEPGYEKTVLSAYQQLPQADVIIFKMKNRPASFDDRIQRLTFPKTMKVSSWQISFRREALKRAGVLFDEHLGAGTGNGGEEELKLLLDCQRAGLKIYYVPSVIASVAQTESTWFHGFDETFFENRGATTRYILGYVLAVAYGIYYVLRKRPMYRQDISPKQALRATLRGIRRNKIGKQVARERSPSDDRSAP